MSNNIEIVKAIAATLRADLYQQREATTKLGDNIESLRGVVSDLRDAVICLSHAMDNR